MNGGLLIDCNGETTVSHLYTVGEVAGGFHGADRLGGNMFSSVQVFGEIAGKHVAQTSFGVLDDTSAPRLERQVPVLGGSGSQDAAELRKRLQKFSTDELLIIRTVAKVCAGSWTKRNGWKPTCTIVHPIRPGSICTSGKQKTCC